MNFSKLLHEFVKVVLGTERLHRILNHTYSESLWRWLFKSEVGTQIQRQRQWQGQWQRWWQTLKVNISYPGHAQSHIVHLVRFSWCVSFYYQWTKWFLFFLWVFFCQNVHLILLTETSEILVSREFSRIFFFIFTSRSWSWAVSISLSLQKERRDFIFHFSKQVKANRISLFFSRKKECNQVPGITSPLSSFPIVFSKIVKSQVSISLKILAKFQF